MDLIEKDVVVVGARPARLTGSALLLTGSTLLARAGVSAATITKYSGTADSPRAHIASQRVVEILCDLGVGYDLRFIGRDRTERSP